MLRGPTRRPESSPKETNYAMYGVIFSRKTAPVQRFEQRLPFIENQPSLLREFIASEPTLNTDSLQSEPLACVSMNELLAS